MIHKTKMIKYLKEEQVKVFYFLNKINRYNRKMKLLPPSKLTFKTKKVRNYVKILDLT